jgi:hypothetical protein
MLDLGHGVWWFAGEVERQPEIFQNHQIQRFKISFPPLVLK